MECVRGLLLQSNVQREGSYFHLNLTPFTELAQQPGEGEGREPSQDSRYGEQGPVDRPKLSWAPKPLCSATEKRCQHSACSWPGKCSRPSVQMRLAYRLKSFDSTARPCVPNPPKVSTPRGMNASAERGRLLLLVVFGCRHHQRLHPVLGASEESVGRALSPEN